MKPSLTLTYHEPPDTKVEECIAQGLNHYAWEQKRQAPLRGFAISVRDQNGAIFGGVKAFMFYGCLTIDLLWVKEEVRGEGWGKRLILETEKRGKEAGCTFVSLGTMDWEALPFYEKLGYSIEFVREGYANDSKMYVMRKEL